MVVGLFIFWCVAFGLGYNGGAVYGHVIPQEQSAQK